MDPTLLIVNCLLRLSRNGSFLSPILAGDFGFNYDLISNVPFRYLEQNIVLLLHDKPPCSIPQHTLLSTFKLTGTAFAPLRK